MAKPQTNPIELYYWPTPNGWKVTIMLEELGVPYDIISVNIGNGEQFKADFLKIAPNNRMPAIVDSEGPGGGPLSLFESGAILNISAENLANSIPPTSGQREIEVEEWLYWQIANVGPNLGQTNHFRNYAPERRYAINASTMRRIGCMA